MLFVNEFRSAQARAELNGRALRLLTYLSESVCGHCGPPNSITVVHTFAKDTRSQVIQIIERNIYYGDRIE